MEKNINYVKKALFGLLLLVTANQSVYAMDEHTVLNQENSIQETNSNVAQVSDSEQSQISDNTGVITPNAAFRPENYHIGHLVGDCVPKLRQYLTEILVANADIAVALILGTYYLIR